MQSRPAIYPIIRLLASLTLMTIGAAAMFATIVALKPIGNEFGASRGGASLPYTLFMLGFATGGVAMGRLSDKIGLAPVMILASLSIGAGFYLAAEAAAFWHYYLAIALLAGFLGTAGTFGPVIADTSQWFDKRRGLAVGIAISGSYVAGAIWPPILQTMIAEQGWREAFRDLGFFSLCAMLPLTLLLWRRSTIQEDAPSTSPRARSTERPLGMTRPTLQSLICLAGIGCCAAMAMPQVHIVPLATDLGISAAHGAEMLSLMLGFGIVSRLTSGWISDRIGGLRTLVLGSGLQLAVLVAFLFADSLTTLYAASIAFGLSQGGIVPSYAIIIRRYFPAGQAGWRIGTAFLFTIAGMALGGWMAGALYDLTGSYQLSFINAIGFNVLNLGIAGLLIWRAGRLQAQAS